MKEKLMKLEDAVELVENGFSIGFGGFMFFRRPMAFIRALIKAGKRKLNAYSINANIDLDMLIGAGGAQSVHYSYFGMGQLGLAPNLRRAAENATIEVKEYNILGFSSALRAANMGLPFLPSRGGFGSDIVKELGFKTITCTYTGQELLAVPAFDLDVCVIHALQADCYGNVQAQSPVESTIDYDVAMARAGKRLVVTVERVVSPEEVRKNYDKTILFSYEVDAVVETPYGAHPMGIYPLYEADVAHLMEYMRASNDANTFENYLEKYVYRVDCHEEYLRLVGVLV
ncbi:MAG: CoA transferase subunit A [Candidatus Freyarchaeota archaeon]